MLTEEDQELIGECKEWLHRLSSKPRYRTHQNIEKTLSLAIQAVDLLEDALAYQQAVNAGCEQSHDQLEQNNTRLMAVCDMVIADRHGHA